MTLEFVDKDGNSLLQIDSPSNPFTVGMSVDLHVNNYSPQAYNVRDLSKSVVITAIEGTVRQTYSAGSNVSDDIIISLTVEEIDK